MGDFNMQHTGRHFTFFSLFLIPFWPVSLPFTICEYLFFWSAKISIYIYIYIWKESKYQRYHDYNKIQWNGSQDRLHSSPWGNQTGKHIDIVTTKLWFLPSTKNKSISKVRWPLVVMISALNYLWISNWYSGTNLMMRGWQKKIIKEH